MRKLFVTFVCLWSFSFVAAPTTAHAEDPHWIWHDNKGVAIQPDEVRYFRKTFVVTGRTSKASLSVAADDEATVYINGQEITRSANYSKPAFENVTSHIKRGTNIIAVIGKNVASDKAGLLVSLEIRQNNQKTDYVVTDQTWRTSSSGPDGWQNAGFDDSRWTKAVSEGKLGDKPWGDVLKLPKATPASALTVAPGFKVDLIRSAQLGEGSWICMTVDQKGRLIISPQADSQPLLRITLTRSGAVSKIEPIPAPVHQAMGLLYAYNSLYVSGHGPNGTGLYRLVDSNHNDRFDTNEVHFLKKFEGEGEHGYHAVVLGPDKMIYVMNGNHTKPPKDLAETSPHMHYQEDLLLPRQWDAGGHAVGILSPGGYVARTDANGKKWELVLAGFRNSYDFDFNSEGEMFTFDSDMEWDWGLPWYRPTRINHCVDAAEFGWRSGSAVWPDYYPDSLPATLNIGVGSPTGVKFGTKSKFPTDYRKAFFILDWSYGRIMAVHLTPNGASYDGQFEEFLKGKPLNLTDLEFGKDGALYFITGGRGTQSGLYRVTCTSKTDANKSTLARNESATRSSGTTSEAKNARRLRHELETLHGKKNPAAIDFAWPHLGSDDRFIRYAARIAIEWQDLDLWKKRALNETNVNAGLTALLALARCGDKEVQHDLLGALKKFPLDSLSMPQKLDKLRVIELSFIRQGKPDSAMASLAIEKLDRLYPNDSQQMNRELSQLLIYLEAPGVVEKTLVLLDKAKTQEEQAQYIFYLRNLQKGWTLEQRKHYFDWFRFAQDAAKGKEDTSPGSPYAIWTDGKTANERHPAQLLHWFKEAGREYADGASYPKYLANIRKDAIDSLSSDERVALARWISDYSGLAAHKLTKERSFVQQWKMSDLDGALDQVAQGRDFAKGKAAFNDAQCLLCHRFGNEGGSIGPELTAASSKYSRRDILEAILEPSKVVSDQFQNYAVVKKDGGIEVGRIVDETSERVVVQPNLLAPERVEISKSDIAERRPSKISPMPEGLLDQFSKEDILDLLAYIESTGKEKASNFRSPEAANK